METKTSDIITKTLEYLVKNDIGEKVISIQALPASGSPRKYFRITTDVGTLIGTYNNNIEENSAFLEFTRHFNECSLPVPVVYACNTEKTMYIQSDFGDITLYNYVEKCLKQGYYDDETIGLYKKALEKLVDFQVDGHNGLDYSQAFPTPALDRASIMDDLNYFKYCFLKIHEDISFNETRLDNDFQTLANYILNAPSNFFMYRDFQSRNIMVKDNELYFIDYQGGRKGPLQYDVISLLSQVKAQIPYHIRRDLVKHYLKALYKKSHDMNYDVSLEVGIEYFDQFFPAFVIFRLLQVLGAYGFRGLIQKKAHFLESIPLAIKELQMIGKRWMLPMELPELQSVIAQLKSILPRYEHVEPEVFTITVNSFSYKNGGVPEDRSGNGGGFVFDCRALPNPGRYPQYKSSTGEDDDVKQFMESHQDTFFFLQNVQMLVFQSIDNYLERGFKNLQISFGCTGGQHRSVYFAQKIGDYIHENYPMTRVIINHIVQHKNHIYDPK